VVLREIRTRELQTELQQLYIAMEAATLALIMEAPEEDFAKSLAPRPEMVELCKSMDTPAPVVCSCCGETGVSPYVYLEKQELSVAAFLDGLTELARRKLLEILANAGITTLEVSGEVALVGVLGQPLSNFAISEAVFREWFAHSVAVTQGVMNTVSKRLVDTLAKGLAGGATRATLAREISQTWTSMTLKHAAMVANTEAQAASQWGTLLGYEFGGVETKSWMQFPGNSKEPRASHGLLDGTEVKTHEHFIVTIGPNAGARLLFPGDPAAPFGETHFCSCILAPGEVKI